VETRSCGRQNGGTDLYRGVEYDIEFLPRIKIEVILLDNAKAMQVVEVIRKAARTSAIGSGRIFIEDLHQYPD
jgi:nitrogen regulatory protein P-II 1